MFISSFQRGFRAYTEHLGSPDDIAARGTPLAKDLLEFTGPVEEAIGVLGRGMEQTPPDAMAFDDIVVPLTLAGRKAVLRFALSPTGSGRRYIELTVWSASGLSNSSQWLDNGSHEDMMTLLRRPEMAADIHSTAGELILSLDRNRMA